MEISRGAGERNTDLSRREFPTGKVAIWIAERSAARQIYGCFEMVLSPEAKQKQTYSCFEMVSPPRKQLNYNYICIAKNLNFTCLSFPTANFIIFSHPPPLSLMHSFAVLKSKLDSGNFNLLQVFRKSFPSIRRPNKLFLLKFLPRFFQKAGKFSPSLFQKAGK